MCTIVVLRKLRDDYPLVLATNRDEFYARLSTGPERLLDQPATVGGRDLVKGGTWMGVTREGLFVGVTNQRAVRPPDPSKRSRGELVLNALRLGTRDAVTRFLRGVDAREYNAFNLMWGDAHELFAAYAREDHGALEIERVPEGVHVLPNDRLDSADFPKVTRAQALLSPFVHGPYPELERALKGMLADRELPPLETLPDLPLPKSMSREFLHELSALCIRTPLYGTRTSTVVALTPGGVGRYLYADGAPDQSEFVDVTPLFG
ncbi:MAG TPA: NRDE family protein [Polyangiales bacterium]